MAGCLVASASWLPPAKVSYNGKEAYFLGGSSSHLEGMYCRCNCEECCKSAPPPALPLPIPPPPGRILNLLDFYRHARATTAPEASASKEGPTELKPVTDDDLLCWQHLMYKSSFNREEVKLRQHAIDVAVSQGTRALVGKKLFVYHFPPGVENQPLLRGGWMRGGIKCYLEGTGEYLICYDNRTTGTLYLGLNFTHFSTRPPLPGSQPQLLPSTDPTPGKRKRADDGSADLRTRRAIARPPPLMIQHQQPRRSAAAPRPQQQREEDESTVSEHKDDDGEGAVSSDSREPSEPPQAARPGTSGQQQRLQRLQDDDCDDGDDDDGGSGAGSGSARSSSHRHVMPPSATPSPQDFLSSLSSLAGLSPAPGAGGWPAAASPLDLAALLTGGGNQPGMNDLRLRLIQAAAAALRTPALWQGSGFPPAELAALQQQLADYPPPKRNHLPS